MLRSWPPLLAFLVNLAAAAALLAATRDAIGGPFVFALDDAYIHLAVARTLAETGTWGVNPGEFASASSSPLWIGLLALAALVTDALPEAALLWNVAAVGAVLWLADALLRDVKLGATLRFFSLLLVSAATPLPFLGVLGMEHVLHLALVLGLLRAADRAFDGESGPRAHEQSSSAASGESLVQSRSFRRRRRALAGLALLSAAACLARYESAFVVGWLAVGLVGARRFVPALVVAGGGAGAIATFGAWSVAQGGLFLPNALYTKAIIGRDWGEGLRATLHDGTPVVVLAAAVGVVGAASPRIRRHAWLFAVVASTHLVFARVGWLYRYEAWLVGWGVLVLASAWPGLPLRGAAAAIAVGLPLTVRSYDAFTKHPAGARLQSDTNMAIAHWIAEKWPTATVAVHDLGAIAWGTRVAVVDLVGIGTTAVTRLALDGTLDRTSAGELAAEREVMFAVTGRTWRGGALPDGFEEAASVWAPFPDGPGEFETVIWTVDPASRAAVNASLPVLAAGLSGRARMVVAGAVTVPLDVLVLSGAAVARESDRIAFYTNGTATFVAPVAGTLVLTVAGTSAEGRGPVFTIGESAIGEGTTGERRTLTAGEAPGLVEVGAVGAGQPLTLIYADDIVDAAGNDRNLFVRRVAVLPVR